MQECWICGTHFILLSADLLLFYICTMHACYYVFSHNGKHFIKNAWSSTTRISSNKGPLRGEKSLLSPPELALCAMPDISPRWTMQCGGVHSFSFQNNKIVSRCAALVVSARRGAALRAWESNPLPYIATAIHRGGSDVIYTAASYNVIVIESYVWTEWHTYAVFVTNICEHKMALCWPPHPPFMICLVLWAWKTQA